ncbi:hypothetical protein O5833_29890, partial [Escherichia coli]|nr:hypothetical protein [Escherichia coli]
LIENNNGRLGKKLWTDGADVRVSLSISCTGGRSGVSSPRADFHQAADNIPDHMMYKSMQEMFEAPVHLELWVKVKSG